MCVYRMTWSRASADTYWHAGRPLPPLFNWYPGELDSVTPDVAKILRGGQPTSNAVAPAQNA